MKKILIPGLLIYALCSGLGLFLRPDWSERVLVPWLAGYLILAFLLSYATLFTRDRPAGFLYLLFGIIGVNFIVQMTGGGRSPVFPVYFLLVAAAGMQHRIWAYSVTAIILAIETMNLLLTGTWERSVWQPFGVLALSLSGVAVMTAFSAHRIRSEAREARASYEKLLSDADAVDPLAGGTNVEALTKERRQAANVSVAREREGAFSEIIDMISGVVPAHTYALFLDDREDGVFSLRAVRSRSRSLSPGSVEFLKGNGLVGICAARSEQQYVPHLVIPSLSLGYYSREVPVKSFLAVPILQGDRVAGVLTVDSLELDAFPLDARQTLGRFAPFFSQIIDKVRISAEMDMRAKNFGALHDMSSILSSSLDISDVLDKLAVQIRSVVSYDFCAFLIYESESGDALLAALKGYDRKLMNARFPLKESAILAYMMKQWQERSVCAVHHDPDLGNRGREIGLIPLKGTHYPIKSLFGRPLVAQDKFIGAAFFASLRSNAFTEYHRKFMDTLLNQVSMVVDNSMLHQSIRDMARTDGLTGLLNHRTFLEKLAEEQRRLERDPRSFSLLLMDIDKFKGVNDKYGHPVGDAALKAVAGILKDTVRGSDFTARYGGEEFAVGMVDTDPRGALQMAERIRKILEKTVVTRVFDGELRITVSIGVSSFPADTTVWANLIALADEALYEAKRTGRNRVCTNKDLRTASPVARESRG
ncbi:MAG TPA: diguanylate cyclase [Nitrospirota bacterium]|nr:diguanylate cyclase [Nitrospirota bacterium]